MIFFFQAEDGIRDYKVTGVQTCALPILTNAQRIKKPLLVVAGANDPRVPVSESEQLVWSVRAAGGEGWDLLAQDEGHRFREKAKPHGDLQNAAGLLQRLAGKSPPPVMPHPQR